MAADRAIDRFAESPRRPDPALPAARGAAPAARVRFFVAGVPKAGTTALCRFLAQHPDVFMCPIKEPSYFSSRELLSFGAEAVRAAEAKAAAVERWLAGERPAPPEHGFALQWRSYEALFRGVRGERAVGEGSVTYLWAPGAPSAIRARFPEARFVLILRDPAGRFFSQYRATRWASPLRTFGECIALGLERRDGWGDVLDVGRYATQLERFFACFPRDRFSIHLYEDLCADPRAVCRTILAFLGVDLDHPLDVSRRINEPLLPRLPRVLAAARLVSGRCALSTWVPRQWHEPLRRLLRAERSRGVMSGAERGTLVEHYRDEIGRTAELIGRDLSSWLR
ncbi:MAG TPA: sulfotransferase [Gammaproteobacteria bacterium]|nr:sulfotransferase [Gammaproteobacteria bacterium]